MDENLHNDRLDEFVNRSFEQYSENPPDSVWDAIEYRLEAPVQPKAAIVNNQLWKYAAALLILLLTGALITQHYSHKRQLAEIKAGINNTPLNTTPNSINNNSNKSISKNHPDGYQANNESTESSDKRADSKISTKATSKQITNNKEIVSTSKSERKTVQNSNDVGSKEIRTDNSNKPEGPGKTISSNETKDKKQSETLSENVQEENSNGLIDVPSISTLDPANILVSDVFNKDAVSAMPEVLPIPAKSFVPHMYASIMASPTLTYEIKPEQPDFDPMHNGQVINEQVGSVYSTDLNLRIGANLSPRWGIESGLCYTNMNRVAEHKPQFKFKDHKHGGPGGPGGPPDNNSFFDFDYGLNTFGGSTTLEVRVENVDSTYMFSDDDPINFNITTNEKLEILRVPLVGVYKVPMGRFGLVFKGGFIGNFLLKNELQITGLNTNDVKLKDKEDNHHQRPPIETPSKFQLGYLFSTGAYYKLTKNLSLTAEPYISGNLSTTNCNGSKLPSYYSIGVNTGLSFSF